MIDVVVSVAHDAASPGANIPPRGPTEHDWSAQGCPVLAEELALEGFGVHQITAGTLRQRIASVNRLHREQGVRLAVEAMHYDMAIWTDVDGGQHINRHIAGPHCLVWRGSRLPALAGVAVTERLAHARRMRTPAPLIELPDEHYGRKAWLADTACPALLIEAGYATNDRDAAWIASDGSAQMAAREIARALVRVLRDDTRERMASIRVGG